MKILVTGCNGQVGQELCRQAASCGFTIIPTDIHNLDITDIEAIRRLQASEGARLIINSAAYTLVDKAEAEADLALAVNATGAANLATVAAEHDIPIFHISTDYIFSGNTSAPYTELSQPDPQGVYGATKLAGEQQVAVANQKFVTLRTSWVFGIEGNNFVKTMLKIATENPELRVVADQFGSPTFAGHIARALLMIAECYRADGDLPWGNYNFCDSGPTTWHMFATRILALGQEKGLLNQTPVVRPILTAEYPTLARRPAYSVLDCSLFAATFPTVGIQSWEQGLDQMLDALAKLET